MALIGLSTAVMAAALRVARIWLDPALAADGRFVMQVLALAGLVALGAAVYFAAAQASGAARLAELRRVLRRSG